ncbi:Type I phosphodiesterase/nucleotide pyrophosphatase [Microbacterium sp. C448]|uniref:alkaline phosphatase family protein n=1 Tax=Microbacterium TaxID=33882 RepID=UPI0003DE54D5|nr:MULTISPECIES: nucleotide pyrophosphatase/phosphodiesterase family protein [Microbacterium]CDK00737.1 Type I phosphodiesterase/nucleotide pyrophosphatase [Microbacterium sp. C448]
MSLMLPAEPAHARSLTALVPDVVASLTSSSGTATLPSARSAIMVVIDGLGAANLAARAGHGRFLTSAMRKKDVARSVFPTTTAAALTSLMTGSDPGAHGIVGYRVRVPGTDVLANQLTGWESDGLDPAVWQRRPTLFETAASVGVEGFVVSREEYRHSGFTRAAFRGSTFDSAASFADRLALALEHATAGENRLVYAYAPELDSAGHRYGWESDEWIAALEEADGAVRSLASGLPADIGVLVTADHGMVDVPRTGHILLREGDDLVDGVAAIAGEPRMLHLYAEPGHEESMLERWRASESSRSWVFSRDEAVAAGLFGEVDAGVLPRIGDVLVAARGRVAYYDDRLTDKASQRMIGQHGSLTSAERIVPLIRLGAYAPN